MAWTKTVSWLINPLMNMIVLTLPLSEVILEWTLEVPAIETDLAENKLNNRKPSVDLSEKVPLVAGSKY